MSLLLDALFNSVAWGHLIVDVLNGQRAVLLTYWSGQVGMNNATLALVRKGYSVHVETAGKELWIIFLEQKVNGSAETLAAMWRPNGTKLGTKFHIMGYTGSAFADRFAVNLPRSAIIAEGPSRLNEPIRRFNQLINYAFTNSTGSRIYSRDIYMRDIKSPYSYNLWSFDLAPDRMFQNL